MSVKGTKDAAGTAGRGGPEGRPGNGSAGISPRDPATVRNVALVGRSGAGKPPLSRHCLRPTG